MLYGCSVKMMKVLFFISLVIGFALGIALLIINMEQLEMTMILILGAAIPLAYPFIVLGFFLNWKKIFMGVLVPIPILSMIIQYFVGMFMGYRAFFWLLKHWKDNDLPVVEESQGEK